MGGNVVEWCASLHEGSTDRDVPIDGELQMDSASLEHMVHRGGCWSRSADALLVVRRGEQAANVFDDTFGFRIVCRPLEERSGKSVEHAHPVTFTRRGGRPTSG